MSATAQMLGNIDLFAEVPIAIREEMSTRGSTRLVPTGHPIVTQGQEDSGLQLGVSGTADVIVHGNPVRTLGIGDYFGEISLIDGRPRAAPTAEPSALARLGRSGRELDRDLGHLAEGSDDHVVNRSTRSESAQGPRARCGEEAELPRRAGRHLGGELTTTIEQSHVGTPDGLAITGHDALDDRRLGQVDSLGRQA